MRHVGLASRASVIHVLVGLASVVQAEIPAQDSVQSFYNGFAGPQVTTRVQSTTGGYLPYQAGGKTTTGAFPLLAGMSDRNKAIITGVSAGAGLAAVAGGIAIAVQAATKNEKDKQRAAVKQLHRKVLRAPPPPPTTTATIPTTTTTTAAGDEIPIFVWIILGILCSCCVMTLVAALATQFSRKDKERRKQSSKRRSASLNREQSRDSEQSLISAHAYSDRDDSSMYSTTYSEYPSEYSQYSQGRVEYEMLPTASGELGQQPSVFSNASDAYTSPYLMTEPRQSLPSSFDLSPPSSFDPYSYAREDAYGGNPSRGAGYEAYGQSTMGYEAYGHQAHSQGHSAPGAGYTAYGQQRAAHVNDAYQTQGVPQRVAPSYARNALYPEEIYSGYV